MPSMLRVRKLLRWMMRLDSATRSGPDSGRTNEHSEVNRSSRALRLKSELQKYFPLDDPVPIRQVRRPNLDYRAEASVG